MTTGKRYTDRNGFGWRVVRTGARVPESTATGVILARDHDNNPSPFEAGRWVSPDELGANYQPVQEAVEAVASALAAGALDDLRANQARKRAEGRI